MRRASATALLGAVALAAAPRPSAGSVRTGLDQVVAGAGRPLLGARVGLIVHAASRTAGGLHAVEALRAAGVEVVRLFTPEHGLRGEAAAGERIEDGLDAETGLRVVSLYGARQRPSRSDLEGLDALVFDLQGAGVRFYTYVSTLILCLEAAQEAGVELVVLDRPNPLGGVYTAGPERQQGMPKSLVNLAPGPLVHGLTAGEMARFAAARLGIGARLRVVPMAGWRRTMVWRDTGRPWVPPSPNLRTAEAALAYPGVCLLEATNLSEGRGSEAPFLLFGAPWLSPEPLLAISAPGFALEPARFTTRPSRAAPEPRYAGEAISGVRVRVTDSRRVDPWELGVRLLARLRALPGFAWRSDGALDRLVGTARLREALERGDTAERILAADEQALAAYRAEREAYLLYR